MNASGQFSTVYSIRRQLLSVVVLTFRLCWRLRRVKYIYRDPNSQRFHRHIPIQFNFVFVTLPLNLFLYPSMSSGNKFKSMMAFQVAIDTVGISVIPFPVGVSLGFPLLSAYGLCKQDTCCLFSHGSLSKTDIFRCRDESLAGRD